MSDQGARSAADDATHGSAIKLVAEVLSRLLMFATTLALMRGLGPGPYGSYGVLSVYALLIAELGELGLQNLASRALVDGSASLRSLVRARLVAAVLVSAAACAAVPLAPALSNWRGIGPGPSNDAAGAVDGVGIALLVAWLALSGWGEFLGVALRCRWRRRDEALLLLVLRGGALVLVLVVLDAGGALRAICAALAVSPLPALVLGALLLLRSQGPPAVSPRPLEILRESAPLALYGGLLLLSPRVELLILSWLSLGVAEVGLFTAALTVYWPLAMVPLAVSAGAMPGLTREASAARAGSGCAGAPVRRRTAATLALLAAPAAAGLALVATSLMPRLLGEKYTALQQAEAAGLLSIVAAAVPALFLNSLVAATLIADARAWLLPWLTASRVALASVLAFTLIPRFSLTGAGTGLVIAEWLLLGLGVVACRKMGIGVPVLQPLGWAVVSCAPMALVVFPLRHSLPLALAAGVATWLATLALAAWLAPAHVRQLTGDFRYP